MNLLLALIISLTSATLIAYCMDLTKQFLQEEK